mmetsp:Transcript_1412/g.4382  ORF Transcript_1412/g.4382 Transcript_1412/m.4382 type:complete len:210 (+) Transcript_1412:103-732(+)
MESPTPQGWWWWSETSRTGLASFGPPTPSSILERPLFLWIVCVCLPRLVENCATSARCFTMMSSSSSRKVQTFRIRTPLVRVHAVVQCFPFSLPRRPHPLLPPSPSPRPPLRLCPRPRPRPLQVKTWRRRRRLRTKIPLLRTLWRSCPETFCLSLPRRISHTHDVAAAEYPRRQRSPVIETLHSTHQHIQHKMLHSAATHSNSDIYLYK